MKPDGQGNTDGQQGDPPATQTGGNQGDPRATGHDTGTGADSSSGNGDDGSGGDDRDIEKLRRTAAARRQEADELKKQLQAATAAKSDLEKKVEEYELANKTELERTQAAQKKAEEALEKAQATARAALLRSAIMQEATKYAFNDPEDLMILISQSNVEWDDEGNPKGIEAMVKKIATDKPYLLKDEKKIIAPPGTTTNTRDGKGLTPEQQKQREEQAFQQARAYI